MAISVLARFCSLLLIRRLQTRLRRNPRLRMPDRRINPHFILQLNTHGERAILRQRCKTTAAEGQAREDDTELFFEIYHWYSCLAVWRFTVLEGFFERGEGFGGRHGGEGGHVEEEAL